MHSSASRIIKEMQIKMRCHFMSITVAKIFKFDDPKNGLGCRKWATVPVTVAEAQT